MPRRSTDDRITPMHHMTEAYPGGPESPAPSGKSSSPRYGTSSVLSSVGPSSLVSLESNGRMSVVSDDVASWGTKRKSNSSSKREAIEQRQARTATVFRQCKAVYNQIVHMERALLAERPIESTSDWVQRIAQVKDLADLHDTFLRISLPESLSESIRELALKYELPTRLWENGFLPLFEGLRKTFDTNSDTFGLLVDCVHWVYVFYVDLYSDPLTAVLNPLWPEALGKVARYRLALARYKEAVPLDNDPELRRQQDAAGADHDDSDFVVAISRIPDQAMRDNPASSAAPYQSTTTVTQTLSVAHRSMGDRFPAPSVGDAALDSWSVSEVDAWFQSAKHWYKIALKETPSDGEFHHHLSVLTTDRLTKFYHACKSLVAPHRFSSTIDIFDGLFNDARPGALAAYSAITQNGPALRVDNLIDLYVYLHSMLYKGEGLIEFEPFFSAFMRGFRAWMQYGVLTSDKNSANKQLGRTADPRLPFDIDGPPPTDAALCMMAAANITALCEYGSEMSLIQQATARRLHELDELSELGDPSKDCMRMSALRSLLASLRVHAKPAEPPVWFTYAGRLTGDMFHVCLEETLHVGEWDVCSPYTSIMVTFYGHMSMRVLDIWPWLEASIPWGPLCAFLNSESLTDVTIKLDVPAKLQSHALPEDWCMRGMDWAHRMLFGRSHWRQCTPEHVKSELDALKFNILDPDTRPSTPAVTWARWRRTTMCAVWLVRGVDGFVVAKSGSAIAAEYRNSTRPYVFAVHDSLSARLAAAAADAPATAARHRAFLLSLDGANAKKAAALPPVLYEQPSSTVSSISSANSLFTAPSTISSAATSAVPASVGGSSSPVKSPAGAVTPDSESPPDTQRSPVSARRLTDRIHPLHTTLVLDTNVALTRLPELMAICKQTHLPIVIPLPVITELEGLVGHEAVQTTSSASRALAFLQASHAGGRISVVSTDGSPVADLRHTRRERIQGYGQEFSMDDAIIHIAATLQRAYAAPVAPSFLRVVLVSFDRNLRLKAHASQLELFDDRTFMGLVPKST